jgi:hypothetical protein
MKLTEIEVLLEYKNPAVLKLYEQNYPNNKLNSSQAFTEVLKYLWLAKKHTLEKSIHINNTNFPDQIFMPRSMREIDEMWHEFILFTEDYTQFCKLYFGEYMHHLPNIFDNMPMPRDVVESEIEKLLAYIYDQLGEDTVKIWFHDYM